MKEMNMLKAIHRDIKNANILLHFPNLTNITNSDKQNMDLLKFNVEVKLADFGFSTIL